MTDLEMMLSTKGYQVIRIQLQIWIQMERSHVMHVQGAPRSTSLAHRMQPNELGSNSWPLTGAITKYIISDRLALFFQRLEWYLLPQGCLVGHPS